MRLYKTDMAGWAGTQADARKLALADGSEGVFKQVEVPTDKAGLLEFLNDVFAWSPDREASPALPAPAPAPLPTHAERSVALDDQFDALPLARQLHFAAVAMENARKRIS